MRWSKFIHLTDTHLVTPGGLLYGQDPQARLQRAVEDIASQQADAAFVLITGDLAHVGAPAAYAALRETLAALPMPVRLVIGNHDDRRAFLAAFPDSPTDADGFVQAVLPMTHGRMLLLDTNEPGVHYGVYCSRRLTWLDRALKADDGPVWIAMHHPPFDVALPSMDRIGLVDASAFAEVVAPHRHRIRHLFFGHVHRPICGSWRGVPFSTIRATNHQVAFDLVRADRIPGSFEPPAYAVVLADDQQTLVHVHDFLDDSPRFDL